MSKRLKIQFGNITFGATIERDDLSLADALREVLKTLDADFQRTPVKMMDRGCPKISASDLNDPVAVKKWREDDKKWAQTRDDFFKRLPRFKANPKTIEDFEHNSKADALQVLMEREASVLHARFKEGIFDPIV